MPYIDPTGLNVHAINPDRSSDPIALKLLDEYWLSGEAMPPIIDVRVDTYVQSERYRASQVKKVGKFPVGNLESAGGQWGVLRFKPGGVNVIGRIHRDPLAGGDPLVLNALSQDLYDDAGVLIVPAGQAYRQHGRILRTWVYQELRETGHWSLISIEAIWSIGAWNRPPFDTDDLKAGEYPAAPVDGDRDRGCSTAFFINGLGVAGDPTIQASFRDITYNFFNVTFAPGASVSGTILGPFNGFSGIPVDGDIYTGTGMLVLVASFHPDPLTGLNYDYNCGNVQWTATWRWTGM